MRAHFFIPDLQTQASATCPAAKTISVGASLFIVLLAAYLPPKDIEPAEQESAYAIQVASTESLDVLQRSADGQGMGEAYDQGKEVAERGQEE